MVCLECGIKNNKDANFCESCGARLQTTITGLVVQQNIVTPRSQRVEERTVLLFAGVVVFFIFVIFGLYWATTQTNSHSLQSKATSALPISEKNVEKNSDILQFEEFVILKDEFNSEITSLVKRINSTIPSTGSGYTVDIHNDLENLLDREQDLYEQLLSQKFEKDLADLQPQLVHLIYLEIGRTEALISGIISARDGGRYKPAFQDGHEKKVEFVEKNAQFQTAYDLYKSKNN